MFVGTIMPTQRAVVGSAVDGRVIDRPFEEGQRIAEGEPLARLLTETISLQLEAEKAELESRRAMLEELETGARPQELAEARAKVAAADARRKYLASKLERTEMAFRQGRALSEDEVEEANAAAEEAQQAYLQAEAQLELTVEGARQERLAQARAAVAFQQAVVDQLQDQIAKHTVRARFTGYVVAEFTERGAWLKRGDPVAEMAALDVVEAVVFVVEQQVPFVPLGSEVLVEVPALPRTHWPGVVAAVVPQADVRARTFPVKVRLQNEITEDGPVLKAGMTARLVLPTGERQDAVLVPKDALVLGGKSPMLYVIAEGKPGEPSTAMPVPVSVGVADGDWIQVIGEVTPGQQVAVQGNERLRPGQPVQVVNAPAAAATGN
jgi:RND family efflux transporter MFP subunit